MLGEFWSGLYPHGQRIGTDHWVVMQGSRPDRQQGVTILVKRQSRTVEASQEHGGIWPLWIAEDGIILRSGTAGGSQGFAWVEPGNVPVYSDQVRASIWAPANPLKGRPAPVCLYEPFAPAAWDWIIGQDLTPSVDRIIAYRRSTDDLFVVAETQSQVRPRGAQLSDGSYVAAISTPGFFVPSSAFTPWTLPTPEPPEPTPEPEPPPIIVIPDPPPIIIVPPTPTPEPEPPPRRPWWRVLLDWLIGGI